MSRGRSAFKIHVAQLGAFDHWQIPALREGLRIFIKPTGEHTEASDRLLLESVSEK